MKNKRVTLTNIGNVFKHTAPVLLISMISIGLLIIAASVLLYTAENKAQPEIFGSVLSVLQWAVTTFGHSNTAPVTDFGKFLAAVLAVLRICFMGIPIGVFFAGITVKSRKENIEEKTICPRCAKANCNADKCKQ